MYWKVSYVIAKPGSKLGHCEDWCDKWSVCLNGGKCKVMNFEQVLLEKIEAEKDLRGYS